MCPFDTNAFDVILNDFEKLHSVGSPIMANYWWCSEGPRISTLILVGSKGHMPASLKDCLILKGVQVLSHGSLNTRGNHL